jgi:hypothetical protein
MSTTCSRPCWRGSTWPPRRCLRAHRPGPNSQAHDGQPTGGNQRGINGGAFVFLRLPGSGIELDLPLIGQFPDGDRPDAGLEPDIPVVPTVSDIASGRDAEMDAVLAAARRATKRTGTP